MVTVNAPRSKAVIGFGGGKRFELGPFIIGPAEGLQNGWSATALTALDAQGNRLRGEHRHEAEARGEIRCGPDLGPIAFARGSRGGEAHRSGLETA